MSGVEQRKDGWWVVGLQGVEPCGPYYTRAEAELDRRGMERTFKHEHRAGFITCESLRKGKL